MGLKELSGAFEVVNDTNSRAVPSLCGPCGRHELFHEVLILHTWRVNELRSPTGVLNERDQVGPTAASVDNDPQCCSVTVWISPAVM